MITPAGPGVLDADPLPQRYCVSEAFTWLRIAERFGQDPVTWIDSLTRAQQEVLPEYHAGREAPEAGRGS